MRDNDTQPSRFSRRGYLGGVASVLAAAAYSRPVSGATAALVMNGANASTQTVTSPNGRIQVTVDISDGTATYSVTRDGAALLNKSTLGFDFRSQPSFGDEVAVTGSERTTVDETWEPVWDRYAEIREHYRELRVGLAEPDGPERTATLAVRVFNDGVGFRIVLGEGFGEFTITSERTEFVFANDFETWWIPNNYNNFEVEYERTPISEIGSRLDSIAGGTFDGVHTPVTMRGAGAESEVYASVHEADLTDYASLALTPTGETTLESTLAPLPDGTKVTGTAPHLTPWRTVQLGARPGDLVESNLHINLNEDYDPEVFTAGVDWIEPEKFIGIWWLMITGRAQWEYQGTQTGNHGAQTGRAKQYMEFASEHGIPGVLIEGWNEGWASYPGDGSAFSFTESYPDFDLAEVTNYGPSLDPSTQMVMHNETAGDFRNYESQLDDAYSLYDNLGIDTIKTGYVADSGNLAGQGFNHHNQVLVNHQTIVAEAAAANRQKIDIHEPIHPTGRRRRYPNLMTREGVKGQEYDSFGRISPEHHVTFPFTRMLGGPVEFTPGIFDMESGSGGIETTRAKQLAMYATYFSGVQMVADLPSSYLADQPAEAAVGELLQAEFCDVEGFPAASVWANAQGERYVAVDPNRADSGATLAWTVNSATAGAYTLHLRYASDAENNAVPADTPRTVTVRTNEVETQVELPPTDYWDTWEIASVDIELPAGPSEVAVAYTNADTGGVNLDAVAITEQGAGMPTPNTPPIRGPTVDAFDFIEAVPAAGWDDTRVLDAEIGDYTVFARQKGDEWYLGTMTDEGGRALEVPLDFLAPGRSGERPNGRNGRGKSNAEQRPPNGPKYVAEIYSDGINAAFDSNLTDVRVDRAVVTPRSTLLASMVGSGGTAVRFRPPEGGEIDSLPTYEPPEQDISITLAGEVFVQEPLIQASGSNDGDYIGGTTLEVLVDDNLRRTTNVRFPPNSTGNERTLSVDIDDPGSYEVVVRTPDGDVLASGTVEVKPPETVATFTDPSDDDNGPGAYTYPTNAAFPDGAFDLERVTVARTPSIAQFTFEVETLNNAFDSARGFSPHMFVCWIRDPSQSDGTTASLDDLEARVEFEDAWHYRLEVSGFTKSFVDAGGAPVTDETGATVPVRTSVDPEAGTVTLSVDSQAFGGTPLTDLELVAMVQSENFGALRPVQVEAGAFVFGGAKTGAVDDAPRVMDLVTPDSISQPTALAYSAGDRATLPFVSL